MTREPKTSPRRIAINIRRIEAVKMRLDGATHDEIAAALGYRSKGAVSQDISRHMAALAAEPTAELRALEVARMDATLVRLKEREDRVLEVRDAKHITVNNGRIIMVPGPPGEPDVPLLDDEPVLRATTLLLGIEKQRADTQQRRAKLLGLNAPTKVTVITDAALDEELAREAAAIAELERTAAAEDPGPEDPEGEED